ncbi:hypothetical protein [Kushneria phyllosphaerae]|uniref:Uncharacterized protein n=1 Tax=Kushneria phyllosphaerae TaxID=2100822 RepID=A0A2R8CK33_9GAMM|nr:hypothetical protein [Kushneria phyllosphaerae]SPJ33267.1 hypothetical protein KSP9073_01271 [Kushneria phyllosphaerae]
MRTSLVSIISALVIATTTGTAMASSQVTPMTNGQSTAMAQTDANTSQSLDTSGVPHRTELKGLPSASNGHSVAMAETYENIHQPLNRQAHSSVTSADVNHASPYGYHSHSPAMTDALASTSQSMNAASAVQVEFEQDNDQMVMSQALSASL